jgi:predicted dehydrogenase
MELVAGGAIGQPRVVRASFGFDLAAVHGADDARFDPALDGGALMDVGCYCVSAARLFGEPERVHGEQVLGPSGVDVVFTATLRLPNDVVAHFDCGFAVSYRDEVEIVGDEATLYVDDPFHILEPGIELRRDSGTERIDVERVSSYRLELENVADAIHGRAPLLLGRDDAVGQAQTIEALYETADRATQSL